MAITRYQSITDLHEPDKGGQSQYCGAFGVTEARQCEKYGSSSFKDLAAGANDVNRVLACKGELRRHWWLRRELKWTRDELIVVPFFQPEYAFKTEATGSIP